MEQNGVSKMIKKINDENGDLCDFKKVKICTKHNFEMQFTNLNILFENFAIHRGHCGKMKIVNLPKRSKVKVI